MCIPSEELRSGCLTNLRGLVQDRYILWSVNNDRVIAIKLGFLVSVDSGTAGQNTVKIVA